MSSYCFFIAASWGDGAVPNHFKALAYRLVEHGHKVVYLPHGQQVSINDGNFHVHSFPSPRPTRPKDFLFLHRVVRHYKPDCMIANFGAVNVMNIIGLLNRVPCRVNWYHTLSTQNRLDATNVPWKNKLLDSRKRLVYRLATHLIANSRETCRDAIRIYRVKPSKTQVFFNAIVDMYDFSSGANHQNSQTIICPGRLDHSKGQDILIKALAYLKPQNVTPKVRFIGAGKQLDIYKVLTDRLDVTEQCVFVGVIPHEEMFREMASAAFTVVPSRSEAFGLVNIESMSVGTPVIASAVGGIPEIIRDGVDGFLVPPDDPKALAEKIAALISDQALREQMGKNARQRFLDVFEQTKNIEQQALWFEELVRQHRA